MAWHGIIIQTTRRGIAPRLAERKRVGIVDGDAIE